MGDKPNKITMSKEALPLKYRFIKSYRQYFFEFNTGNNYYLVKWEELEETDEDSIHLHLISVLKLNPEDPDAWQPVAEPLKLKKWKPSLLRSTKILYPYISA